MAGPLPDSRVNLSIGSVAREEKSILAPIPPPLRTCHQARYVLTPFPFLSQPLFVDRGTIKRLDQLEDQAGLDLALGAEHRVVGRLTVQLLVMQPRRNVLVHVP